MGKTRWLLYVAVLVVLLVPANLAGAAAPAPAPAPAAPKLQGTLYFPVFDTDAAQQRYNLVTVDLATGERKTLLQNASQPAISHDGKAITYKSWVENQNINGLHAAVLSNLAGTDWRYGISVSDQRPGWAPNDSFFSFYSRMQSDHLDRVMITRGATAGTIFRPDVDNKDIIGKATAVVSINGGFFVLYQGCEYTKCGVWQRSIGGAGPVQLNQETSDQAFSVSPDEKTIAFMAYNRAKDWEVYTMAVDGTNVQRLTTRVGIDGLPTWSADGKWIAFVREVAPNNWDIMAIQPDGKGETKLTTLGALNGKVMKTTPDQCQGWIEEQISWY